MTSRTTFGDLAAITARHLEAPAQQIPVTGRPSRAQAAAEAGEFLAVLPRMLKTIVRYTTDIATASAAEPEDGQAGPWARAATEAHRAAQYAYRLLPLEELTGKTSPHRHVTSSLARNLDAAATAMTAARDLLHTHFHTTTEGTRTDRTEWAHVITSAPVQKALLSDLAAWSRHVVSYGSRLTSVASHPGSGMTEAQRRLLAICRSLTALITAVETAHSREPVTTADTRQLHHIPASTPPARHVPARAETVTGLQIGIAECAERVRSAAATAVPDAAWSPAASAESFTQTAVYATLISHHCEILQQSLAARAAQLGATRLRTDLLTSATTAARSRQRWLTAARAWYHIKTDTTGGLSPAAEEAADLALWTGRLAYADPAWTLTSEPDGQHRPPQQLAPDPGTFTRTITAVQQATSTLTTLAAADYTQTRTAALSGRLLVPAVQAPSPARNGELYIRAPDRRARELLTTYRDAGTACVNATAKIEAVTAKHQVRGHQRVVGRLAPAHAIALSEPDPPAGAIERALSDLGVIDAELLDRGMALDKAAAQLIAEAADQSAPQRWHGAVTRPGALTNASGITRHVIAADQSALTARLGTSMRALASSLQAQPEPLQAEP